MNTLIEIKKHEIMQQAVDAKQLYLNLDLNKSQWSRWCKQNIENNPFAINGTDYEGFDMMSNGNITRNYLLSIDFAKKLAMQVKTEKGEQVRDYFLECERQLAMAQLPDFTNPAESARAWADEFEQKQIALQKLELAKPKIAHYDTIVDKTDLLNATQVAQKIGMTAQQLNKRLDKIDVYNKTVKRGRAFNSWFIQEGLGQMKQTSNGYSQAMFTLKGEAWIVELLGEVA